MVNQEDRRRISARETDIAMKKAIAGSPLILPMPVQRHEPAVPASQPVSNVQSITGQQPTQTIQVPRSAPCPCGSGQKYKRCCGINAPAVLSTAA